MSGVKVDELREAGLIDLSSETHLTDKGRDWLRALSHAEAVSRVMPSAEEAAEDLVLSTSGIFR